MTIREVRILHIGIGVPMQRAFALTQRPEHFPRWAAGLADSLRPSDRGWIADMPQGEALIHFSSPNDFGILDHRVVVEGSADVLVPMRMVANGDGTEVELVLFRRAGMSDADFKRDARMVRADLQVLKALLEAEA